jgi:hypothetical protein
MSQYQIGKLLAVESADEHRKIDRKRVGEMQRGLAEHKEQQTAHN